MKRWRRPTFLYCSEKATETDQTFSKSAMRGTFRGNAICLDNSSDRRCDESSDLVGVSAILDCLTPQSMFVDCEIR
jgi:hypothetical protein